MPTSLRPYTLRLLLLPALLLLSLALSMSAQASAGKTPAVQLHLLWGDVSSAEKDAQLDEVKRAGAKLVRIDLGWQTLEEGGKGQWNQWYLDEIDETVAKAEARGIKVLFTVMWTPCWASSAPSDVKQGCSGAWWSRGVNKYPPNNAGDYADAVRFLARRYAGRVDAWEIWNEPNLKTFFEGNDPVGSYAKMLKAAYPAIKQQDPRATVVGGSLSESDHEFAEKLYREGIKGSFDAFSIHPYSHDYSPLKQVQSQHVKSSFVQGVPAVREVMRRHGDSRPMWLTEFGWSTSTVRGGAPWENGVSEDTQAEYLKQAYTQMRKWDYVDVGVWFGLKNWEPDREYRDANYGLMRHDGSKKPAWGAFQRYAAPLANPNASGGGGTPPATKPTARVRVEVKRCKDGHLHMTGTSSRGGTVHLALYRRIGDRFAPRSTFRVIDRVMDGRFRKMVSERMVRSGEWRVVARPLMSSGQPMLGGASGAVR